MYIIFLLVVNSFYVNPFLKDKSIRMINFTVFTF